MADGLIIPALKKDDNGQFILPDGCIAVGCSADGYRHYKYNYCKVDDVRFLSREAPFNEVILEGYPNHPYLDIEWYGNEMEPLMVMETIYDGVRSVIDDMCILEHITNENITFYTTCCSRDYTKSNGQIEFKHSYHVLINCPFYFKGAKDTKPFAIKVIERLKERDIDEQIINAVDMSVYDKNKKMRLIENKKSDIDTKKFKAVNPSTLEEIEKTHEFDYKKYYITYLSKEQLEQKTYKKLVESVPLRQKTIVGRDNESVYNIHVLTEDFVKSLYPKWDVRLKRDGDTPMGGLISRKEVCPIHGKVHASQNLGYYVSKDNLYIKCFSPHPPVEEIEHPMPIFPEIYLEKFAYTTNLQIKKEYIIKFLYGSSTDCGRAFYMMLGSVLLYNKTEFLCWNGHSYIRQSKEEIKDNVIHMFTKLSERITSFIYREFPEEEAKKMAPMMVKKGFKHLFFDSLDDYASNCAFRYNELETKEHDVLLQMRDKVIKRNPNFVVTTQIDLESFHKSYILDNINDCFLFEKPSRDILVQNYIDREFQWTPDPRDKVIRFLSEIHSNKRVPDFNTMYVLLYGLGCGIYRRPPKKAFLLYGKRGNNGKSTLFSLLKAMLGKEQVGTMSNDMLAKPAETSPGIVKNKDKSILICPDLPDGYKLQNTQIKQFISGGHDSFEARTLFSFPIEFTPKFTIFINCNKLPDFDVTDNAMVRRLCILPYNQSFEYCEDMKPDEDFLIDEPFIKDIENNYLDDFLTMIIVITEVLHSQTLGNGPKDSKRTTDAMNNIINSNPVCVFKENEIETCEGAEIPVTELKRVLAEYCLYHKIPRGDLLEQAVMKQYTMGINSEGVSVYKDVRFKVKNSQ